MHPIEKSNSERFVDPLFRVGSIVRILIFSVALISLACSEIRKPATEPFFSQTSPPVKQQFRWSNGDRVKTLDPALASAPPETDIVRALFDGLTELHPQTLQEMPAAAESWTPSKDYRTWTFQLRKNITWSDGKPVTASDFVRAWKRLATTKAGSDASFLIDNIAGMRNLQRRERQKASAKLLSSSNTHSEIIPRLPDGESNSNSTSVEDAGEPVPETKKSSVDSGAFGAVAVSDSVLKVTLVNPDKDFPKLVAHPIFSPIAGDGSEFDSKWRSDIKTNGAFRLSDLKEDVLTLERSADYWNRDSVQLEQVQFIAMRNAEQALQAYRAGQIDALTNAELEPLAQKLLAPYNDFRQTVHNALNFYEFNLAQPPFTDRRVREALTIVVERERLTEGEMKGATAPAYHLFPFEGDSDIVITRDVEKAKRLLESAGFPNGANFPAVRLVVNRNDTQQRVARSVARTWKADLNIDTEIIVKESDEMDAVKASGDYDLIRRGLVFPSVDRNACMAAIFLPRSAVRQIADEAPEESTNTNSALPANSATDIPSTAQPDIRSLRRRIESEPAVMETTLEDAVFEFRVVPLYFPVSYSLVKPYVHGFDSNGLDAPSLKTVRIDSNWQPATR
jgi:oligopeptide transport system substrate-binding protein